MKFLIRLYPRTWRTRYGDEFEALLQHERLGFVAIMDIIVAALFLRLLSGWAELREAGTNAYGTFQLLPRGAGFSMAMALLMSFAGLAKSGYTLPGIGLFVGALAVLALKLLHPMASERDGHRARVALVIVLHFAMSVYFLSLLDGRFPFETSTPFRPSLMGLILAIGARDHPWPTPHRLRIMGVAIWASTLQSLSLLMATIFGLLAPLWWGALLGTFSCLMTFVFVRERRRLEAKPDSSDFLAGSGTRG